MKHFHLEEQEDHWPGAWILDIIIAMERITTDIFNKNTLEHLHRYAIAQEYVKDKRVLDIASGEGYGSNLLAESANSVIGVDIDEQTVQQAARKYKRINLQSLSLKMKHHLRFQIPAYLNIKFS